MEAEYDRTHPPEDGHVAERRQRKARVGFALWDFRARVLLPSFDEAEVGSLYDTQDEAERNLDELWPNSEGVEVVEVRRIEVEYDRTHPPETTT